MGPAMRIDRAASGIVAMLSESCAGAVLRHGHWQLWMALVRLVEHRAEIAEMPRVPAEVAVVAHRICNADDGIAESGARGLAINRDAIGSARRRRYFAAIREGCRAIGVL